jgi:hypothetical protein
MNKEIGTIIIVAILVAYVAGFLILYFFRP